ncbi:uncharacterized membrane protein At1g16860-like [Dioscorea cayenensis subsp. rotundata]|uniref:Uncharacterized membrane protein At1g16860-like n=1 Tax=Dioscorea cayennensis subsp. rotundata TaxID=55577 RepID=A0AB40B3H6_DIOCR|nr:uncharacterized membrane protein At1g16860-like [Dioscorea cayenensis subsp. rotundata]
MNDLSSSASSAARRRSDCSPVPAPVVCVLVPILLAGLAVSLFILVVVHNALLFIFILLISALAVAFLAWNAAGFRKNAAVHCFVDRFPVSDLRTAKDGELVKITGFASCADISLEASYEKVERCVYTSTLLYECNQPNSKAAKAISQCFPWELNLPRGERRILLTCERFTTDFYITDARSGVRALVKAGNNSKVFPLVYENTLIKTASLNRELSLTLKNWLDERHLSAEARLLRLEEGYIKEGSSLTVMGTLNRKSGALVIVPPSEPLSTGCLFQKFLLPVVFDGLVIRFSEQSSSGANLILS